MAAPAFRSFASVEDDNGPTAELVQTVPSGTVDGDILLWFVNRDETTTTRTFPAGWTKLGAVAVGGDGGTLARPENAKLRRLGLRRVITYELIAPQGGTPT